MGLERIALSDSSNTPVAEPLDSILFRDLFISHYKFNKFIGLIYLFLFVLFSRTRGKKINCSISITILHN